MEEYRRIPNLAAFISICCCCFLSSACSIAIDFVVVNQSSTPIQVTLKIRHDWKRYIESDVLSKQTLSDSEYKYDNWKPLGLGEYTDDEVKSEITISVKPQEALRIEEITNYDENSPDASERYRIKSLKITGSDGEVSHTDEQARIQFNKTDRGHRQIVYR